MKRKIIPILIIILCGAYLVFQYVNRPHKSISSASADYEMTAGQLYQLFDENEEAANKKYLDKTIVVKGIVSQVNLGGDNPEIILSTEGQMGGVSCSLDPLSEHAKSEFMPGQTVSFKCICNGFLMDVVLQRCIQVEN
jgi:hypothetical protein